MMTKSSARNLKSRIDPHIANDPARARENDALAADYRSSSFDKFSAQQGRPAKSGFHAHDFHALGTGPSEERLVRMETSAQYLKFAETCDRMAKLAKTERHRMTLKEMAEIWRKLAQEADTKDYSADTKDYSTVPL
jgi:hypothetical protein